MRIYIKKVTKSHRPQNELRTAGNVLHVVWRVSSYLLGVKEKVWYPLMVSLKKIQSGNFCSTFCGIEPKIVNVR